MTHLVHGDAAFAPDANAVLTKATLRAAQALGLSGAETAVVLGVSEATMSRLRQGSTKLESGSKPFELAVLLVRLFRSLDAITGGDDGVRRAWMSAPNLALGRAPREAVRSITGLIDVLAYLDARRAVV